MFVDILFFVIGTIEYFLLLIFQFIDNFSKSLFPSMVSSSESIATYMATLLSYINVFSDYIPISDLKYAVSFVASVFLIKYLLKWIIALFNMTPWFKMAIPSAPTKGRNDR